MTEKRPLYIIALILFINMLGFSSIFPLLPYYADKFKADEAIMGALIATYATAQFIGAPILGRLSDRFGRRPILLVSVLGTAISLAMLGVARSMAILFLARALDGITGGNISVAQAYITDKTDKENRTTAMGLMGAAMGMGFIFGPAIGGILISQGHYSLPALVAASLAVINLILIFFFLPESIDPQRQAKEVQKQRASIWQTLRQGDLSTLLATRFFYGLAFTTFETVFSLFALKQLGINATQNGLILTYASIIMVYAQTGGLRKLTPKYNDYQIILGTLVLLIVGLALWSVTTTWQMMLIVIIPIGFAGGLLNSVLSSVITKVVSTQQVGEVLGVSSGLDSMTRVIAPILGGVLMRQMGAEFPAIFAAGFAVFSLLSLQLFLKNNSFAQPLTQQTSEI